MLNLSFSEKELKNLMKGVILSKFVALSEYMSFIKNVSQINQKKSTEWWLIFEIENWFLSPILVTVDPCHHKFNQKIFAG